MNSPMDGQEIVNKMHEELKKEIPGVIYDTFLSYLKFESLERTHLTLLCDYTY